jgi:nucleotide-binding universal stress UspA family protein
MHVLIATDGSEISISAARRGCELLGSVDEVTLVTVVTEGGPDEDAGGIEGPVLTAEEQETLWKQELADARAELARTSAVLHSARVHEIIETGDAADAICQTAKRLGVDVIIVGSHGRTGLGRLFLGSVSEHVVRHAPSPVLVVRPPPDS